MLGAHGVTEWLEEPLQNVLTSPAGQYGDPGDQWLCAAFALVNLYQHRNRLAPQRA